jgi:hypothetical protein
MAGDVTGLPQAPHNGAQRRRVQRHFDLAGVLLTAASMSANQIQPIHLPWLLLIDSGLLVRFSLRRWRSR